MNLTAAFPVTEASQVAEPRRAVQVLARRLGFSDARAGGAALIVSELATNLARHARGGEVLMRPLHAPDGQPDGLEVVALDTGPGIADVASSRRDGYSTAGTLGHGLGTIHRQADWCDLYTDASGTAIAAGLCVTAPDRSPRPRLPMEIGAAHVSKPGESVCGDAWSWRMRQERLTLFVADGLGHGLAAHDAAEAAVRIFAAHAEEDPAGIVQAVHAGIRSTRGAAVAVLALDRERRVARFAGLGNIAGAILLPDGGVHRTVSHPGTAGHVAARIQEFTYPAPRGATIVLCSDGIASGWSLSPYPGLQGRSPSLAAGVLYRDFSRRRDDVTVVVAKDRPAVTEKL